MVMKLDLYPLRAFFEASRLGSYTAAARRLHVTQSAVSHAVSKLESSAGQTLVEWRARRLTLTPAGEALRESCERIFGEIAAVEEKLSSGSAGFGQAFRLGAPVEFGTTVLIPKLGPFIAAHPRWQLDFHFSNHLEGPLLRDEIDLAVDCRPHLHPDLARTSLFREKYVVVAAPSFLETAPVRTPRDLALCPVLSLDKGAAWWSNMLLALPEEQRPVLRRVVEVDHLRGIINAALSGLGIGLVPKYTVLGELASGKLTVLFPELPLVEDRFYIFQRQAKAGRESNRALTAFLRQLDTSEFADAIPTVGEG